MLSYVELLSERVIIPISIITVQEKKVILEKIIMLFKIVIEKTNKYILRIEKIVIQSGIKGYCSAPWHELSCGFANVWRG